jgi:hypothetical protein
MEPRHISEVTADERRRLERPVWLRGVVASAALHLLVLLYFPTQSIPVSPNAAAGPRAGDDRAAAGGLQTMNMRVPPPRPVTPPSIPVPTLTDVQPVEFEPDPDPVFEPAAITGDMLSLDSAPGIADGTGEGDGGTSDEGLFRLEPPRPQGLIPPRPPDDDRLRGTEVRVWVFVDARGRVVADSTRLDPPTPNRGYNRRLIRDAAEWRFYPAERDGRAVASWFDYNVAFGS